MSRIRSIHPGIYTDEAWASVSVAARWMCMGICTEADDNGVFEWKPLQLKMRIFPADTVDVPALLEELCGAGIVRSFEAEGKKYGALRNFCRFQRPRKPKSWFAITDEVRAFVALDADAAGDDEHEDGPVRKKSEPRDFGLTEVPPKSEKSPQMEDGGWKRENKTLPLLAAEDEPASDLKVQPKEPPASTAGKPRRASRDETFERFKAAYPKRDGQQDWPKAREAFDRFASNGADPEAIIRGAELYAADVRRRGVEKTQFVKQARTWLNGKLWLEMNELATPSTSPPVVPGWPQNLPAPDVCKAAWSRGQWPGAWGAPPGSPTCRVPAELVTQWRADMTPKAVA
ncbi:hypothetical protein ACLBXM_18910 [Xanthobacteraceae bacterium A53D]